MRLSDNPTRAIVASGIVLSAVAIGGIIRFGGAGFGQPRPVVQLPWVQPAAQSLMILAALAISVLCYARYRALGGPWSYWMGTLFLAAAILGVFYQLSWPGLLGEGSIIADLSNTASWFFMVISSTLSLVTLAVAARRPAPLPAHQTRAGYAAVVGIVVVIGVLSVVLEHHLPTLVVNMVFTRLTTIWELLQVVVMTVGAIVAYRRYAAGEDNLFAYASLFLLFVAFAVIYAIIGGQRYDVWWYLARVIIVSSYMVLLFGFLEEGYNLYTRERLRVEERDRLLRQLEELAVIARARAVELDTSNKELESFSYSVSHDLRSPLAAILLHARILRRTIRPGGPGSDCVDEMITGIRQMDQLITGLLALSRVTRQAIVRQTVAMPALVQEALTDVRQQYPYSPADVRIGNLPDCRADPVLLKALWTNLLSNAFKFTARCTTPIIEIGSARQDDQDVYFVRDNGVGFDMQYVDHLFGVFQRLHKEEDFQGSGVGLAIVRRVVQRHGGRVWAEGAIEKGATFYFTL